MQAQSSDWLAYVLFVLHKNVNTVNLTREMLLFFILLVVIWTPLQLKVMGGAKHFYNIFEWGREIKMVGNHCFRQNQGARRKPPRGIF